MKKSKLLILMIVSLLALTACSKNSHNSFSSNPTNKMEKTKQVTKIKITVNGKILNAQLNSTAAAKEFKQELPKTLTFTSFMSNPEKMADLNHSLSLKGMPKGDEGKAGEIGYWAPDRRIIFYYGHVDYYPGIHIIGKFNSKDYYQVISKMKDNTKVKFELAR